MPTQRSGKNEEKSAVDKRKEFYRELNKLNRAALCCSGGGIRSATFCLGVIQSLARYIIGKRRIAGPVSELSSCGHHSSSPINRCSAAFIISRPCPAAAISDPGCRPGDTRDDFPTVWKNLAGRPDGPDVEPPEISWLRAYSNYLTPQARPCFGRHLDRRRDLPAQSASQLAGHRPRHCGGAAHLEGHRRAVC